MYHIGQKKIAIKSVWYKKDAYNINFESLCIENTLLHGELPWLMAPEWKSITEIIICYGIFYKNISSIIKYLIFLVVA